MTGQERTEDEQRGAQASFIVRVRRDESGELTGLVRRVRTGEEHAFRGGEMVVTLIARMLRTDATPQSSELR